MADLRPEAQRLVEQLDRGEKYLVGDRLVNCAACHDSGVLIRVLENGSIYSAAAQGEPQLQTIPTELVPCHLCDVGRSRAIYDTADGVKRCAHDWQATPGGGQEITGYHCPKCGAAISYATLTELNADTLVDLGFTTTAAGVKPRHLQRVVPPIDPLNP